MLEGRAQTLRIYLGEDDMWKEEPLHLAIMEKCQKLGIAGGTVLRGVQGYVDGGRMRPSSRFPPSHDLPVVVSITDSQEKIRGLLPALREMVGNALIVISEVGVITGGHQGDAHSQ